MRFGKSTAEYETEQASRGTGDGAYMKYLRQGDNEIQPVDEYDKWVWFWEHYNPNGFPFPCTGERDSCPGCTSKVEKMQKASRRAAFNAFDGEYTNVWKIPKTVAEKLKNRYERLGTITDRPYVITQIKNDQGFYDYDIEGQEKRPLDMAKIAPHLRDPEELLASAFENAWGTSETAQASQARAADAAHQQQISQAVADREKQQDEKPPFEPPAEENEYSEAELRAMSPKDLRNLCATEGLLGMPSEVANGTADDIVNWMLTKVE